MLISSVHMVTNVAGLLALSSIQIRVDWVLNRSMPGSDSSANAASVYNYYPSQY